MSWFVLALIAPLLWAVVNLIDDHLLSNVYRSAAIGTVISGIAGFMPAIYLGLFNPPESLPSRVIAFALTAGLLTVLFYYFYFRTLDSDDPSVAIALNNIAPALVLILAFAILDEKLQLSQYIGVLMIITGSFVLAALDIRKLKFATSIWFAICGSLAYATVSILAKYAYEQSTFSTVYFWISVGFGLGGLIAFCFLKDTKQFGTIIGRNKKKLIAVLVGAELINIAAEVVQGAAISGGPVGIVRGLEGIQPLYVLAIGIILGQFFPRHFRERKDGRFYKKIGCMSFMLVGIFLL